MATLTVVNTTIDISTSITYDSAAAGGDQFVNDGNIVLLVRNGSGSSVTVTITPGQAPYAGGAYSPLAVAVPAGDNYLIGPFRVDVYNDNSNYVQITYSATTSVTLKAIRVRF